jgi:hypothetical protein
VWSAGAYTLWRPSGAWVYPIGIENPNGIDGRPSSPTYWLGGGVTRVRLFASDAVDLQVIGRVVGLPELEDRPRRVRISSPVGSRTATLSSGVGVLTVPVKAGTNEITLEPLDRPDPAPPHGDQRPLVVGLNGLLLSPHGRWAMLSRIVDGNGLEQLDRQSVIWIDDGAAVLEIVSGQRGPVRIAAKVVPGPGPDLPERHIRVAPGSGDPTTVVTRNGRFELVLPLEKGRETVTLRPLDPPRVTASRGRGRVIVGIKELEVLALW